MVAFLLVFIASRTAVNSVFIYSSMACFAIGAQVITHTRRASLRLDRLRAKHASLGLPTTKRKRIFVTLVPPAIFVTIQPDLVIPFLVEPIGCWASTVARLQEARHLSFTWCCWQGGDYTTTTTAAPTPTPCTFIALPDADPTSCLGRVNHHRTKWVLPPQRENTALHGCVNRQSHHDSQHGTHRSMRMYQTPSQGQGVEAIVQTSSTHSVMSVMLVERPIPSALLSKPSTTAAPHTTMLPETAARPVSMTMRVFLTTSWWDPRPTLARPHCKGGVRPHIRGRVFGILHAVFEVKPALHRSRAYVVNQGPISWFIH